ncbi:MAG: TonB-dependent receptor [Deltaproteobacteria bacterium]|jgi:iron complex outermembrane receptor protein|nr:TonB-dependent receptor [Deltaproteobacteria bacterium]
MKTVLTFFVLLSVYSISFALEPSDIVPETAADLLLFYDWEELIVATATGTPKPIRTAPAVASVITAEDIENIGATTLDEVLETVPGIHIFPSSLSYFTNIWSIRGIYNSKNPHVLMLINNVPYQSPYAGNRTDTYKMPVSMISRVEVVRGPGSALYGADAFSGVINVITKDNFGIDGVKTGFRAGSFETYDAWFQYGGQHRGWDLAFGVEWQETDGDDDRIVDRDRLHFLGAAALSNAPGPLDTRYRLLDANLLARKNNFSLRLYGSVQESACGPGGAQTLTYNNELEQKNFLADLTYQNDNLVDDWNFTARLHYIYKWEDLFLQYFPSVFLNMLGNPISTMHGGGAEIIPAYEGFNNHLVRLGAGIKYWDFEPDQYKNFGPAAGADQFGQMVHVTDPDHIYISSATRRLWYALIQDEWNFARHWELTAGVRYDNYSDFGSSINPRIALVWETRHYLTTKLLYGQAFRAPSFGEQYAKNNPVAIGDPNITPEEIETIELAFDYQPTEVLRTALNLFYNEAEDLIDYIGGAPPVTPDVSTNITAQTGHGLELEVDWLAHETFRLRANLAYQRSENDVTNEDVIDTPELQFYLNPHWAFLPGWSLDIQYFWIGNRHRAAGDTRDDIDDYDLVNLSIKRKNIAKHWDVALAVRNLFDEDARESSPYDPKATDNVFIPIPNDYPMEGRSFYAELRYTF